MQQGSYIVRLDAFQGPLDLLLYLIRRAEVEITDIPIAQITDQYVEFLQQIDQINVEVAAEFLLMAATLVEIKSRTLRPPAEDGEDTSARDVEDLTDPRSELIQQLMAYKRYREAATDLDARRKDWAKRPPITPRGTDRDAMLDARDKLRQFDIDDLQVFDLFEAFQDIIAAVDLDRLGDHEVTLDDTPTELHKADLVDQLQRAGEPMTLRRAFAGRSRSEMIGLFLGLLELVKDRLVTVRQDQGEEQIVIELNTDPHGPHDPHDPDERGGEM